MEKLSRFKGGDHALQKAVGEIGKRPPAVQVKATPEFKELLHTLADDMGVDMSKLVRWLVYRFAEEVADAKRKEKETDSY